MVTICRLKTTGKIVYPIDAGTTYTTCVVPYGFVSKKGHRAGVQTIRNEKLTAKEYGYG